MNEQHLCELTLSSAAREIQSGSITPTELVQATLRRIERINNKINAYVTLLRDQALLEAKSADKEIESGKYKGPLHGVPIAIKDVIDLKGIRTTAGSKIFADNIADRDATAVKRLKTAGAIILGKLNTHEIAFGTTTYSSLFGQTRNPWHIGRVPGGSSGGSAAAVAASICIASLGNDGGGSIRVPAAFCGVVGLKPTYSRVSRHGVFPLVWSLDHLGPITKTVQDAALVLNVIAGRDPLDPSSSSKAVPDYTNALSEDMEGIKVGYIHEYTGGSVDEDVDRSFKATLKTFENLGATVEELSLPWIKYSNLVRFVINGAEAGCLLWNKVKDRASEMDKGARMYLASGALFSASDYLKAQQLRTELIRRMKDIFRKCDILVSPTCPITAHKIGRTSYVLKGRRDNVSEIVCKFAGIYNLTGLPAISVACGFDSQGLPIGLQIAGRDFEDELVLKAGYAYQAKTHWHEKSPPV